MPSLGKGHYYGGLSSSLKEEVMSKNKQGIVSILGSESDGERSKATASLRRTLSADMSSKKWQAQHGFIPLKRIASSEEIPSSWSSSSSSSSDEVMPGPRGGPLDFWGSVHNQSNNTDDRKGVERNTSPAGQFDIWSSIVSQKAKEDLPPPYVHPLVKRSASSLSGKSLEICTESLGSETGSDGFSSYPSSEAGDQEEEDDKEEEVEEEERFVVAAATPEIETSEMDWRVAKYNMAAAASKRVQPRSFPPPIPSLSSCDGSCVRMMSRRDNGRLVLEAVSVPSQNNFRAERQDGRLVLTFIGISTADGDETIRGMDGGEVVGEEEEEEENEAEAEQFDVEIGNQDGKELQEEGGEYGEKVGFVMELDAPRLPSGVIMHKLAFMMKKPRVLANMNPTWTHIMEAEEEEEEQEKEMAPQQMSPVSRSLPPRPPVARRMIGTAQATVAVATKATGSLNAYEYYWKAKSVVPTRAASKVSGFSPPVGKKHSSMFESDNNNNLNNNNSSNSNSNNNNLVVSKSYMANERQQMMLLRGNRGDYLVPLLKGCKEPRRSLSIWEPHCIATS